MNNKDKFLKLVDKRTTNIAKKNKKRIKYRFLIRIKNEIKLWILNNK